MSNNKNKKKNETKVVAPRVDLQVTVIFQARTANISNNDRICAPDMLFISHGDMRSLNIKAGGCAHISSSDTPDGMIFQVWPSPKCLANHVTLNRIHWPNFRSNSDAGNGNGNGPRLARISRLTSHIEIKPCKLVTFTINSSTSGSGSGNGSSSKTRQTIDGELRQFCDHVKGHLGDSVASTGGCNLLRIGQRLGLTWRTSAVILEVISCASNNDSDDDEDNDENDDEDEGCCYRVDENTQLVFEDDDNHAEQKASKNVPTGTDVGIPDDASDSVQHKLHSLGFGAYTKQAEQLIRTAHLALARKSNKSKQNPFQNNQMTQQLFKAPKGVLIHGPSGVGKSFLINNIIQLLKHKNLFPSLHVIKLSSSLLLKSYNGDAERELNTIFNEANLKKNQPGSGCVIIMDDVDCLCKRRDDTNSSNSGNGGIGGNRDAQKRLLSCLLTLIDGSGSSQHGTGNGGGGLLIIAASNRPHDIDPAMRRPGRLDVEIELGVPVANERSEILSAMLSSMNIYQRRDTNANTSASASTSTSSDHVTIEGIESTARAAHGYVAADILLGVKEACIIALTRSASDNAKKINNVEVESDLVNAMSLLTVTDTNSDNSTNSTSTSMPVSVPVSNRDLVNGMNKVTPSALLEAVAEIPTVKWDDIGGMHQVKQSLKEVVEWPLLYPHLFQRMSISPPQGVLLYGPPGCSKTLMAKALATESGMNFLSVRGPELLSKWLGESEKAIQTLFRRARSASPCIVFFDEIDALAGKRGSSSTGVSDRVLAQLLSELDGISSNRSYSNSTVTVTVTATSKDDNNDNNHSESKTITNDDTNTNANAYATNGRIISTSTPIVHSQVILIAATNRPDVLDKALLRPGRIDRKVYVPPPDYESRRQILEISCSKMPMSTDINLDEIAKQCDTFSGAEVVSIMTEAAMLALDANDIQIMNSHIQKALHDIKPQITKEMLAFYEGLGLGMQV